MSCKNECRFCRVGPFRVPVSKGFSAFSEHSTSCFHYAEYYLPFLPTLVLFRKCRSNTSDFADAYELCSEFVRVIFRMCRIRPRGFLPFLPAFSSERAESCSELAERRPCNALLCGKLALRKLPLFYIILLSILQKKTLFRSKEVFLWRKTHRLRRTIIAPAR